MFYLYTWKVVNRFFPPRVKHFPNKVCQMYFSSFWSAYLFQFWWAIITKHQNILNFIPNLWNAERQKCSNILETIEQIFFKIWSCFENWYFSLSNTYILVIWRSLFMDCFLTSPGTYSHKLTLKNSLCLPTYKNIHT